MLKFTEINFEKIIADKIKEDRTELLTEDEIIQNGGEDTELLLAMSSLNNRKIPEGYILNPIGINNVKEILKNLKPIISQSDCEAEIEIMPTAIDYDKLSINIKCDCFTITHNDKPQFLKILSLADTLDTYARNDGKMGVAIEVSECLSPILGKC